ncbi:MAG: hypothetical protein WAL35_01585 [Acidimicrobiales bacterium]
MNPGRVTDRVAVGGIRVRRQWSEVAENAFAAGIDAVTDSSRSGRAADG